MNEEIKNLSFKRVTNALEKTLIEQRARLPTFAETYDVFTEWIETTTTQQKLNDEQIDRLKYLTAFLLVTMAKRCKYKGLHLCDVFNNTTGITNDFTK